MEGQPTSPYAVQAVRELGIDISSQRAGMVTPDLIQPGGLHLWHDSQRILIR